jgi:hypothetical protein
MTNSEVTYIYRREVAKAIKTYGAALRAIHLAYGSPIPPSIDCMSAMGNAWGTCRVAFKLADLKLEQHRASL